MRLILLIVVTATIAALVIGCGDETPSSGTSGRLEPTNPAGLSPDAVLEYDGRQYAPVAVRTDAPTDDFTAVGRGKLSASGSSSEVEVFINNKGDPDKQLYTLDDAQREGGSQQQLRVLWAPRDDTNSSESQ